MRTSQVFQALLVLVAVNVGARLIQAMIGPADNSDHLTSQLSGLMMAILPALPIVSGVYLAGVILVCLRDVNDGRFGSELRVRVLPRRDVADAVALSPAARAIVDRIMQTLAEIHAAEGDVGMDDASYSARAIGADYLPATITSFLAIPASRRVRYEPKLLEQLATLDRASDTILDGVAASKFGGLGANGRFLEMRFARPLDAFHDLVATSPAEHANGLEVVPTALIRRGVKER